MFITKKEAENIVEIIWKHFDKDNNGYIDQEEAKELFEFLFTQNDQIYDTEILDDMFKTIDANNDNRICKEEVIKILCQNH